MQKPGLFGMNGFMVFLLTCFSVGTHAQQAGGLILMDAESKQAFTVRIGDQMYSSSAHGHLVLSHLKDSLYRLCLQFPNKNHTEQVFPVKVHQKDLGFILKGADSSWVLYNWQSKETIHPVYILDSSRILEMGIKREDGFSRLMAAVVNDSNVMYNTYLGNGFNPDDSLVIGHRIFVIGEKPGANNPSAISSPLSNANGQQSAKDSLNSVTSNPSTVNRQMPVPIVIGAAVKKPDKDSLVMARRQQIHLKDSLQAVRKAEIKDSLLAVRIARVSRDSLMAVRRAFSKDSLLKVKKFTKDSLSAVKAARKDSLQAVQKASIKKDSLLVNASKLPAASPPLINPGGQSRQLPGKDSLNPAVNKPPTANQQRPMINPGIKKLREVSLKISRKMIFLDPGKDGKSDTITLFVYFETADNPINKPVTPAPVVVKKAPVSDTAGLNKALLKNKIPDTAQANKAIVKNKTIKPERASCLQIATEEDMLFLRSTVLKTNTEQEKIAVVSGAFSIKCFTVAQVRLLAALFGSDKARYRLMDAAQSHIADREHFPELANMYTDKNFQRKFLVMAEKRS